MDHLWLIRVNLPPTDTGYDTPVSMRGGVGCSILARDNSRPLSGLLKIFSSLNRLRAEIGGQFRMMTLSSSRNSVPQLMLTLTRNSLEDTPFFSSCARNFFLRSSN